ncbi:hypothetical protein HYPSUDRAFT_210439 [Hypholoma sublateritium FD-334 SS-4]|uniref:Uncharacterized protein n=1 Tax=Hypholoma sublateritium (strain FD-334 SS-4) TaxID=945553 RepID=A0A0D2NVC3_HYPSF|nr:hypothetical protein HYPSUDRAFT_210439 [Hypholoma sublateritium FD-334 SS-4]
MTIIPGKNTEVKRVILGLSDMFCCSNFDEFGEFEPDVVQYSPTVFRNLCDLF